MHFSVAYAIKEVAEGRKLGEKRIERVLGLVDDAAKTWTYNLLSGAIKIPNNILQESKKAVDQVLGYQDEDKKQSYL